MSGLMHKPAGDAPAPTDETNGPEDAQDFGTDSVPEFDPKTYMREMKRMADELHRRDDRILELAARVRVLEHIDRIISNAGIASAMQHPNTFKVNSAYDVISSTHRVQVIFKPSVAETSLDDQTLHASAEAGNGWYIKHISETIARQIIETMPSRMTVKPIPAERHRERNPKTSFDPNKYFNF